MRDKTKNIKETSQNIKAELTALLKLNQKRKSALEKLSKSVMENETEPKDQIKDAIEKN